MFRAITITAVLNGFVIQVGCQTLVFNSSEGLTKALKEYLDNPDAEEKRWLAEGINTRHTNNGLVERAADPSDARAPASGAVVGGRLGGLSAGSLGERIRDIRNDAMAEACVGQAPHER